MNRIFIKVLKQIARVQCENSDKNVVLRFVYTNTEIRNNRNNGNNKNSWYLCHKK